MRHTVEHKRRRVLTERELATACRLAGQGATQTRIAAELRVSQPTVARLLRRVGENVNNRPPKPQRQQRRTAAQKAPEGDRASERSECPPGPQDVMAACSGCTPDDLDRSPCPGHAPGYSVGPRESWGGLLDRLFDRRRRAGGEESYRQALRDFAAAFADLAAPALPTLTAQ